MKILALGLILASIPLIGLGGVGRQFTWNKISKMRMIRGMDEGATTTNWVVTGKWADKRGPDRTTYYLSWGNADIRIRSHKRLNFDQSVWNDYAIGDTIEIITFPGDNSPYHRDGIFASDGNFVLDRIILYIETAMIGLGALFIPLAGVLLSLSILKGRGASKLAEAAER